MQEIFDDVMMIKLDTIQTSCKICDFNGYEKVLNENSYSYGCNDCDYNCKDYCGDSCSDCCGWLDD